MVLGRRVGVGIAMNPQSGEILALVNLPGYDNNVFGAGGSAEERHALLISGDKPLFDRAVSGLYNPGSTIKPLVGIAALKEGVINPAKEIFSPGYLEVPNPYNLDQPSRYLDWRYQGNVNMASAIAQSSNVYFYSVGGGTPEQSGLGISRLRKWWEKFGFGRPTGIDLPNEAEGLLPSPDWKEKKTKRPWLLGDTYNVSIGQGDLLVTPIQLLNYVSAIANGGRLYKPTLDTAASHPEVLSDLSYLEPEIREVRKGMAEAVKSPLGTANLLSDLAFAVEAKTGSAQVAGNTQENAFFVGYPPMKDGMKLDAPQDGADSGANIAILVLIENSREGSLNAVPIAKDVLDWYYWHKVAQQKSKHGE